MLAHRVCCMPMRTTKPAATSLPQGWCLLRCTTGGVMPVGYSSEATADAMRRAFVTRWEAAAAQPVAVEITAAGFSIAAAPTAVVTVMVTAAADGIFSDGCLLGKMCQGSCLFCKKSVLIANLDTFACSAAAEVAVLVKC